jgi:hypothetical protein
MFTVTLLVSTLVTAVPVEMDEPLDLAPVGASIQTRLNIPMTTWAAALLLEVDPASLPTFPWDPIVSQFQRFAFSIGTGFLLAGCGCCCTGILTAAAGGGVGGNLQSTSVQVIDDVLTGARTVLRYILMGTAMACFTPPTLCCWSIAAVNYGGSSLIGNLKSPRAKWEDAQRAKEAEARRKAEEAERKAQEEAKKKEAEQKKAPANPL